MKNISFSLNAVKNFICTFPPFFHLHFSSILSFESVQAGLCIGCIIYYHIILYLTFFYFFLSAQQTEPGSLLTGPAAPEPFLTIMKKSLSKSPRKRQDIVKIMAKKNLKINFHDKKG